MGGNSGQTYFNAMDIDTSGNIIVAGQSQDSTVVDTTSGDSI